MTIIKWILFFILMPFIYSYLFALITFPLLSFVFCIIAIFASFDSTAGFVFLYALAFTFAPFTMYLYAKIFGLFKYIDSLKFALWVKILLVLVISAVLFLFMYYPFEFFDDKFCFWVNHEFSFTSFSLIQSFFIYKLLQHLTQKHPVPFKALAYYFSVEFYKSVAKKLYNKLKSKSKRD